MISRPFIILVALQFVNLPLKMRFLGKSRHSAWIYSGTISRLGFLTWGLEVQGVCQLKLLVKVCMIDVFLERRLIDFSRFTKESVTLWKLRAIDLGTVLPFLWIGWNFWLPYYTIGFCWIGSYLKLLGQELGTDSRRANKWLHRPTCIHRHPLAWLSCRKGTATTQLCGIVVMSECKPGVSRSISVSREARNPIFMWLSQVLNVGLGFFINTVKAKQNTSLGQQFAVSAQGLMNCF